MIGAALLFGAAMAGAALAPTFAVELVLIAVVGALSVAFQSTGNSTLQLAASPSMRGRVMSLWAVAFLGSTPIGGPIAGAVSDALGGRGGLALGAVSCVLAAALGAALLRGRARRDDAPAVAEPEPDPVGAPPVGRAA
jgi:MFS family permease